MDIDAEMAQLQAEAQRRLRAREEEERALLGGSPRGEAAPSPTRERPAPKPAAAEPAAAESDPAAALARLKQAAGLAAGVASASASAQETVAAAGKLSLAHKLGLAAAGVVVFAVSWKLFLQPVAEALVVVALLVLILAGIGKLVGWVGRKDASKSDASSEEQA